jgi:hypothetical protein
MSSRDAARIPKHRYHPLQTSDTIRLLRILNPGEKAAETRSRQAPTTDPSPL